MAIEIERKFLVSKDWENENMTSCEITQGYLTVDPFKTIRIRIEDDGLDARSYITIKGSGTISRREFEYSIPLNDAKEMIENLCTSKVIKTRYTYIAVDGKAWSIDKFHGKNSGLVIAEVELFWENQYFSRPSWIDQEITENPRFTNSNLSINPYSSW